MKKSVSTILLILIFLVGLSLLLYPTVSDYVNSLHSTRAIVEYSEQVAELENNVYKELWEAARSYNQELLNKADRYVMSEEEEKEYENQLNVLGNGIIGYIKIPAINCYLPIYHGTDEAVLQIAVGHVAGTSLPVGGKSTHCVLSAHRGLPSARLFTDLDELEKGDIFYLYILDEVLTYEIDQIKVVTPEKLDNIAIEEEKDYCTLATCTPYGINTHRLLVRGHRIRTMEKEETVRVTADAVQIEPAAITPVIVIIILILLVSACALPGAGRRKKNGGK